MKNYAPASGRSQSRSPRYSIRSILPAPEPGSLYVWINSKHNMVLNLELNRTKLYADEETYGATYILEDLWEKNGEIF